VLGAFVTLNDVAVVHATARGKAGAAAAGGGIFVAAGDLVLHSSAVEQTMAMGAGSQGGGIYIAGGDVRISNSVIERDEVDGRGSAGAGLLVAGGWVRLDDSALVENGTGTGGRGGGLSVTGGELDVVSSTLYGNSAGSGGAAAVDGGQLDLVASTLVGNHVGPDGFGAAISSSSGTIELAADLVADNTAVPAEAGAGPPGSCSGVAWITDEGANVVDDRACGLGPRSLQGVADEQLGVGAFGDHGGATPTVAVAPSGQVAGEVPAAFVAPVLTPDGSSIALAVCRLPDQRGEARLAAAAVGCGPGAYAPPPGGLVTTSDLPMGEARS
jgi:hypothetical protein